MPKRITKNFLIEETKKLLKKLGDSDISPSAYDTAWVARIQDKKDPSKPMFPECLEWVLKNQKKDGSWGAEIEYYHDRVICTLSCLVVLLQYNNKKQFNKKIESGIKYLEKNLKNLSKDCWDTIGFEMIFPVLANEISQYGVHIVNDKAIHEELKNCQRKLSNLPKNFLGLKTTITHSLEAYSGFLRNTIKEKKFVEANGSVGGSPSASAFFYIKYGDDQVINYLKKVKEKFSFYAPSIYPFEIFEKAWKIFNHDVLDLSYRSRKDDLNYLFNEYKKKDLVGISKYFSVVDLDDTVITYLVLRKNGYKVSLSKALRYFNHDGYFKCFCFEKDPSISANIHLLHALSIDNKKYDGISKKILSFLISKMNKEGYFFDKWHISPYYPTCHFIIANNFFGVTEKSLDWILKTQRKDGGWGFYNKSTLEETCYCLQVFLSSRNNNFKQNIFNAKKYIKNSVLINQLVFPQQWIDKVLYCPYKVVTDLLKTIKLTIENEL